MLSRANKILFVSDRNFLGSPLKARFKSDNQSCRSRYVIVEVKGVMFEILIALVYRLSESESEELIARFLLLIRSCLYSSSARS